MGTATKAPVPPGRCIMAEMSEARTRRRWLQYSLRTMMLWVVPYVAVCLFLANVIGEPIKRSDSRPVVINWVTFVAIGIVSIVWSVLFWEDHRARRREAREPGARPTDAGPFA